MNNIDLRQEEDYKKACDFGDKLFERVSRQNLHNTIELVRGLSRLSESTVKVTDLIDYCKSRLSDKPNHLSDWKEIEAYWKSLQESGFDYSECLALVKNFVQSACTQFAYKASIKFDVNIHL